MTWSMPAIRASRDSLFGMLLAVLPLQSGPGAMLERGRAPAGAPVTLVAGERTVRLGDADVDAMTYNGDYAGPLVTTAPGATLRVVLVNRLSEDTNLHFHGLSVSPRGHGDDTMIRVPAGSRFAYELHVPSFQTPGLYWYHAHVHGSAEEQVGSGLSGPLLVGGPRSFAALNRLSERVIVLKQFRPRRDDGDSDRRSRDGILTIGASTWSRFELRPGERELWHIGNFGANKTFFLSIARHAFTIVGRDGVPVAHPYSTRLLDVDPGARYEALVTAGPSPGSFAVSGYADDLDGRGPDGGGRRGGRDGDDAERGHAPAQPLGVLNVAGPPSIATAAIRPEPSETRDLSGVRVDAHRTFVFGRRGDAYTINGRTFDPARVDVRVPLGNVEDWTIADDGRDMHVFHIHQVHFQVIDVDGVRQPFDGARDTVRVMPRERVTVRIAFTDPEIVGTFMFHCHILEHEDAGMMARVQVYDPRRAGDAARPLTVARENPSRVRR